MADPAPIRMNRDPSESDVGPLLRAAQQIEEQPQRHAASKRELLARVSLDGARWSPRRLAVVGCALIALIALANLTFGPAASRHRSEITLDPAENASARIAAPSPPENAKPAAAESEIMVVENLGTFASTTGKLELQEQPNARMLVVRTGTLRADVVRQDPKRPLVVQTPHLRVVVVGTRFEVHVDRGHTLVSVLHGRVRVESSTSTRVLEAGESIDSEDASLRPAPPPRAPIAARGARSPAPIPPPTPVEPPNLDGELPLSSTACARSPEPEQRKQCWAALAEGPSLAAQNALYALGAHALEVENRPEQALEHWLTYERRFPDGVLSPEIALGVFKILTAQGRLAEADQVATEFVMRHSEHPRAPEIMLWRAAYLCSSGADGEAVRALIARLESSSPSAIQQSARLLRTRCVNPIRDE